MQNADQKFYFPHPHEQKIKLSAKTQDDKKRKTTEHQQCLLADICGKKNTDRLCPGKCVVFATSI
jgi:hypothetical protein